MTRDLDAEIRTYLAFYGPATATEVANGVRARRSDVVRRLLRASTRVDRPEGGNPRAAYFNLSQTVPQPLSGVESQTHRILGVLRDGKAHTTADIHAKAGFSRLNSRIAELRARGYVIETSRVPGETAGPHAQTYRLIDTPNTYGDAA